MFVAPMAAYLPAMLEGEAPLAKCPNINAWSDRMAARESFSATQPQLAA
mgnify:CR=1 FL=1